jgi:hypothetical protein
MLLAYGINPAACFLGSAGWQVRFMWGQLAPSDLEPMMTIHPYCRLIPGAMLMGLLACASSTQGQTRLHFQRNAELDRLDRQAGMPDTWLSHYLNAATTYIEGPDPAAASSRQRLAGERIE